MSSKHNHFSEKFFEAALEGCAYMRDALIEIMDEYARNKSNYVDIACQFTRNKKDASEVVKNAFIRALQEPLLFDLNKPTDDQITAIMLDILQEYKDAYDDDFDVQSLHPSSYEMDEIFAKSRRQQTIRQIIGEKSGLETKELLAVMSEFSTPQKTGNMLMIEDVGPEHLDSAKTKIGTIEELAALNQEF